MKRTSVPALAVSLLLAFSASLALGCSGGAGDTGDAEAQAQAETPSDSATASDDGFEPSYIERGAGDPLILLHGNGGSALDFAAQIEYFQGSRHVYALDTRGQGSSPRGTAPYTLSQFADDLLAFMDGRGIEKADILGFSDGANIAMLFALAHPERVESLVLNSGNLSPEGLVEPVRREIDAQYQMAQAMGDKQLTELTRLMAEEPQIDPADLGRLGMPVLVIAGSDDMVEGEHTRLIAGSIPGAELKILDGTHFVAFERPDEFNEAVAGFLSRADQAE